MNFNEINQLDLKEFSQLVAYQVKLLFPSFYKPDDYPALSKFIFKIINKSESTPEFVIIAICLLQRLRSTTIDQEAKHGCCHKLFLTSLILSNKFHSDSNFSNAYWSQISKIFHLNDINKFEFELLRLLNHDINIDFQEFHSVSKYFLLLINKLHNTYSNAKQLKILINQIELLEQVN